MWPWRAPSSIRFCAGATSVMFRTPVVAPSRNFHRAIWPVSYANRRLDCGSFGGCVRPPCVACTACNGARPFATSATVDRRARDTTDRCDRGLWRSTRPRVRLGCNRSLFGNSRIFMALPAGVLSFFLFLYSRLGFFLADSATSFASSSSHFRRTHGSIATVAMTLFAYDCAPSKAFWVVHGLLHFLDQCIRMSIESHIDICIHQTR